MQRDTFLVFCDNARKLSLPSSADFRGHTTSWLVRNTRTVTSIRARTIMYQPRDKFSKIHTVHINVVADDVGNTGNYNVRVLYTAYKLYAEKMNVINSDELKKGEKELKHMARMPYGNNSHPLKNVLKNTKGLVGAVLPYIVR